MREDADFRLSGRLCRVCGREVQGGACKCATWSRDREANGRGANRSSAQDSMPAVSEGGAQAPDAVMLVDGHGWNAGRTGSQAPAASLASLSSLACAGHGPVGNPTVEAGTEGSEAQPITPRLCQRARGRGASRVVTGA